MRPIPAVALMAALAGTGCYTMSSVPLTELSGVLPARVWVTRGDHSTVVLDGPRVLNNQLRGFVGGTYQVMPAADVQQVRIRRPAPGRTGALVAAGTLGAAATIFMFSGAGKSDDPCSRASSECVPGEPYTP